MLASLSFALLLAACKSNQSSTPQNATVTAVTKDTVIDDMEPYRATYVVIADTGKYHKLLQEMLQLSVSATISLDTPTNIWDSGKHQLLNTPDPTYIERTIEYYPRNDNGLGLSIEYLGSYDTNGLERLCLVAALCDRKAEADSILAILKPHASGAYIQHANIYTGCMY